MKQITHRAYRDEEDLPIILELLARVRPPEFTNDYPVRMDIEENFASDLVRANARLWFNNDEPIAWAYVDEFNNLRWEIDDQYREKIGHEMIEWGEACIRKTLAKGETGNLDASCRESDSSRVSFLKQHGFHPTEDVVIAMTRLLSDPILEPVLPPGFIIRPIAGICEAQEVAAMHRAAFGTDSMTTQNRLAIMHTTDYDRSLDLVVVAPHGTIVANCICSVNERDQRGNTDPVLTHPHYQRMGLARALLLTGLRSLKERGLQSAHLGTSGGNTAMQKAAQAVGFKAEHKIIWFSKAVNRTVE